MKEYYHSVRHNKGKCKGCVHCLQSCPTQAIRVRNGKAYILEERCIDCGECFRVCPNSAKVVSSDRLESIREFTHRIVLPPPAFFVQFPPDIRISRLLKGLEGLGFDSVFEVGLGAEMVAEEIRNLVSEKKSKKPLISSSCPAVVRLIQVNYPNLVEEVVPLDAPVDIAAELAKKYVARTHHLSLEKIGAFFLTSCSAKVTSIKSPEGGFPSFINGAIPISSIYVPLLEVIGGIQDDVPDREVLLSSGLGLGWEMSRGIPTGIGLKNSLSVNGIYNTIQVLEEVEMGHLNGLDYIECHACYGGCIGGILNVQNRFLAEVRMKNLIASLPQKERVYERLAGIIPSDFKIKRLKIEPRPISALSPCFNQAAEKLSAMEEIVKRFPGIDCGSCGSPTCCALAEDIVLGRAKETDCIFTLINTIEGMTDRIHSMTRSLPALVQKRTTRREGEE